MGLNGTMDGQQHQQTSVPVTGLHGNRSKSPPLSSAASQASLSPSDRSPSPSDRSPSETELSHASSNVSLTSSPSRPSSVSPLPPQAADDTSREGQSSFSPFHLPHIHVSEGEGDGPAHSSDGPAHSSDGPAHSSDGPSHSSDGPLSASNGLFLCTDGPSSLQDAYEQGESQERGGGSDAEEEYFEEYHLPNTHENAFVRHRSFRRKVELTPINAPDAEKIEGLVRTGEFERHGSMRRKIVPNVDLYKVEEIDGPETADPPGLPKTKVHVREFKKDFREIEKLMDGDGNEDGEMDNEEDDFNDSSLQSPHLDGTPRLLMRGSSAYTSTPSGYASTADYASIDLSASLHSGSIRDPSASEDRGPESMSIEQSTINKVRDCMDFSKCKDIYNLSGKLQDILTPVEVEEVLNNSHRYIDYIDSGVLEALFTSVSEQLSLTGQPLSISFNRTDASFKPKTPEQELTPDQVQLQYQIKQKLLMEELALDSLPYISNGSSGGPAEEDPTENQGDSESRFGTIERRKSLRLKAGRSQVEVQGVFVESDFQNSKLKKITAPHMDLALSGSMDDLQDLDSSVHNTTQACSFRDFMAWCLLWCL
ncbi:hypothetical protein FHG87_023348 [Trinorchestia longiramus]|nr:hypothetical protein FHG87_023348 [Trinorchestia longiramus]